MSNPVRLTLFCLHVFLVVHALVYALACMCSLLFMRLFMRCFCALLLCAAVRSFLDVENFRR